MARKKTAKSKTQTIAGMEIHNDDVEITGRKKWPLEHLKVGQSIIIEEDDIPSARSAVYNRNRKVGRQILQAGPASDGTFRVKRIAQ